MCGIFGITVREDLNFDRKLIKSTVNDLFKLSESRGKEAAGMAIHSKEYIKVFKQPIPASVLIKNNEYNKILDGALVGSNRPITIIGHSRLVTNGAQQNSENNQPVIKDGIIGIHNGIIVNDRELWKKFPFLERKYEVDTEIMLSLIRHFYKDEKLLTNAINHSFKLIKGTASIALLFNDIDNLLLATNNGSLYVCTGDNIIIFASELYILKKLIIRQKLQKILSDHTIAQVKSGTGWLINIHNLDMKKFLLCDDNVPNFLVNNSSIKNIDILPCDKRYINFNGDDRPISNIAVIHKPRQINQSKISIRRCNKCILPETMPFIEFDNEGTCNYCRNYKKIDIAGKDSLEKIVEKYRSKTGEPDCIVTFSGGRDSSYGLHYIKTVLKMNPVAYTYDWGMITDLARRNIARICGKLGVEHILVSADINKKRDFVKKNVIAWLNRPDLGMVPLFMAGDKQYFYYANKLMKETGIELVILNENMLENTFFKSGYCGIMPQFGGEHTYSLKWHNKMKLASYYARQYFTNPSYINSSILDTVWAAFSYYLMSHEYLNLYRYIKWDEKIIESTLIKEYDWEVATDTQSTWRIGDGTAAFYNYIYHSITGFTENDTFRSNQIREGVITREDAIRLVEKENVPRYDAIKWYCDTIGINFDDTLDIIDSIPKLYKNDFYHNVAKM